MFHFFLPGRELIHAAAIYNIYFLCAEALSAAGSIHGNISAAYHSHLPRVLDRGLASVLICLHQIDSGQEFIGGIYAFQALAGNIHKAGESRAGTHEDRLISHLKDLIDGKYFADDHIGLYVHADGFQIVDLLLHDGLWQTEFRDAVDKYAAGEMQCLEDGNLISHLGQISRYGKAAGAGSDHSNLVAVWLRHHRGVTAVLPVIVRHKPLQTSDPNGFAFDAPDAFSLALGFLWADTSAHSGKGGGL